MNKMECTNPLTQRKRNEKRNVAKAFPSIEERKMGTPNQRSEKNKREKNRIFVYKRKLNGEKVQSGTSSLLYSVKLCQLPKK